jgi:hypothetical protein
VEQHGEPDAACPPQSAYSLVIQTGSQLVVGQLPHGWQVKAANPRPLVDEAAGLPRTFGHTQIEYIPAPMCVGQGTCGGAGYRADVPWLGHMPVHRPDQGLHKPGADPLMDQTLILCPGLLPIAGFG